MWLTDFPVLMTGYTLDTEIYVSCDGWRDEGEAMRYMDSHDVTLSYVLLHDTDRSGNQVILMSSPLPRVGPVILPAGNEADDYITKLRLEVRDPYDGLAYEELNIKV